MNAHVDVKPVMCAACGCELAEYEIFASRIRTLKAPVCLGCALSTVVFLRDEIMPMLENALGRIVPRDPRSKTGMPERIK